MRGQLQSGKLRRQSHSSIIPSILFLKDSTSIAERTYIFFALIGFTLRHRPKITQYVKDPRLYWFTRRQSQCMGGPTAKQLPPLPTLAGVSQHPYGGWLCDIARSLGLSFALQEDDWHTWREGPQFAGSRAPPLN